MPYKDPEKAKEAKRRSAEKHRERTAAARRAKYAENIEQERTKSNLYYAANVDKIREQSRSRDETPERKKIRHDTYEANKEAYKVTRRAHYSENREMIRAKQRDYYENNKEGFVARAQKADPEVRRKYLAENPDVVQRASRKRRAQKRAAPSSPYGVIDVLALYGTDCHICGEPIDLTAARHAGDEGWQRGLHLDHLVPLSRGGTDMIENIRPAHGLCNMKKHATHEGYNEQPVGTTQRTGRSS